ncbi:HesA/MoeB/ThiF family protein [Reinekea sp.]|jgi:molybdopterin/thiamine biosynthesis adenylyltransferase|uniref:HesA/MoeB/ThiF family protein n=1 Tax=Reinekea sp. TaxID=1970455 RepID=UPI003989459C
MSLTDDQLLRYARNILLNDVDITGQEKLLASHVLVVGIGGLGSPIVQYLAAAGIGTLTLADADTVEETNLQRQVIHSIETLGQPKVSSAQKWIRALNPDVKINALEYDVTLENAHALVGAADVVVIGTDNYSSRYLLNSVCCELKTPLVSAAAIGLSGQLTSFLFNSETSPCFACLYPEADDDEISCTTAGVLGPVVGTMGSLAALEVIKILLSFGQPLSQQLLTWDAKSLEFQKFNYAKSTQCSVCNPL